MLGGRSSPTRTAPAAPETDSQGERRALALCWVHPPAAAACSSLAGLVTGPLRIGRDPGCAVVIDGDQVSREHAELRRDGPLVVIRDLDSRNGTFVNARRIEEAPLRSGDVLRIGELVAVLIDQPRRGASAGAPVSRDQSGLVAGPSLRALLDVAATAAPTDLPIVIRGETGTGKEVLARYIHARSGRRGPFLAINCGALPESLAEAELFGFRRAAFTGADQSREGHFRAADGGTLLLDEIGDLSPGIQGKLLRVLEQREVLPLGDSRPVKVDVRVLAACQEDLRLAVEQGRFRADLFARLNGLTIDLPPLRSRREEVPALFLSSLAAAAAPAAAPAVSPRLIEHLCLHRWPFNARELVTLARKVLVLAAGQTVLSRSHLPAEYRDAGGSPPALATPASPPSKERQLSALQAALHACGGNLTRAAAQVGVSRMRAYRLIRSSDLDVATLRRRSGG